ncbi:atlastin-2-like, partial [Watersipora subatra]|uniref:atlastin-2-like n=1 Tax=Watersipora subatra TaxID=2589382 RepID=UPI00355B5F7C
QNQQLVIKLEGDRPSYDLEAFEKMLRGGYITEDAKVFLICISGTYRSGKSFLLNLMKTYLDYCTTHPTEVGWKSAKTIPIKGGHWAGGETSVTHGIWMYMYPKLIERKAIILMDCQGTADSMRSNPTLDNLILFLGLQLADVHILNVNQSMGADAISRLSLCAFHADENATGSIFKRNIILVRDWRESHRPMQLDDLINKTHSEALKTEAEGIKKAFKAFEVEGLPHPGFAVVKASERSNITLGDVDPEFLVAAQQLFKKLVFQLSSEATYNCEELLSQFKFLSMRAVGKIKTPREAYEESLIKSVFEEVIRFFETEVAQLQHKSESEDLSLPQMETSIENIYKAALQQFQDNLSVKRCESEDIKADYRGYLEKAYKNARINVKQAFEVTNLRKQVDGLTIREAETRRKCRENEENARRANEKVREANQELKKAKEDCEEQQKQNENIKQALEQAKRDAEAVVAETKEKERQAMENLKKVKDDYEQQQKLVKEASHNQELSQANETIWKLKIEQAENDAKVAAAAAKENERKAKEDLTKFEEHYKQQQQLGEQAAHQKQLRYEEMVKNAKRGEQDAKNAEAKLQQEAEELKNTLALRDQALEMLKGKVTKMEEQFNKPTSLKEGFKFFGRSLKGFFGGYN